MIYHSDKALFVKIAERLCDDILADRYREGDRVPSVRELAAEYEVNTNTALRARRGQAVLARDRAARRHPSAAAGHRHAGGPWSKAEDSECPKERVPREGNARLPAPPAARRPLHRRRQSGLAAVSRRQIVVLLFAKMHRIAEQKHCSAILFSILLIIKSLSPEK